MHRLFRDGIARVIVPLLIVCTLSACNGSDVVIPAPLPETELYWTLQINYPAIRLSRTSPYDTVTLQAQPYTLDGTPWRSAAGDSISDSSPTIWYSTDSARVLVDANGVVRARDITGTRKVYVVARRQLQNVTREDRALVQVVDLAAPPIPKYFSARPVDTLENPVGTRVPVILSVRDQDSVPITGLPVHYRSVNTFVGQILDAWSGVITAGSPTLAVNTRGTSRITASTWAYGVAMVDTFTLRVGWPLYNFISVPRIEQRNMGGGVFTPFIAFGTTHIGVGGMVAFSNNSGITGAMVALGGQRKNGVNVDIIFDDPANVSALPAPNNPTANGNIIGISGDTVISWALKKQYRSFFKEGEFGYTMQPFGIRGKIVVHDD